jgi:hemerythrin
MALQWTEDLATGVVEVDNQHKEIFRRIEALLEACREGKGREKVGEVIAFLGDYVVMHFAAEERLQKQHAYPEYEAHKRTHEKFLKDFGDLKAQFDEEGGTIGMVLATNRVVVDWLVNHIKMTDKKMAVYVRENK